MPTYQYICANCGLNINVVRSIHSEEDTPNCSTCKTPANRVYEATPVAFKGGGFYSTDSRG